MTLYYERFQFLLLSFVLFGKVHFELYLLMRSLMFWKRFLVLQDLRAFLSQLKPYFSEEVDSTMIATLRRDPLLLRSHMVIDHRGDPKCLRSLLYVIVYDNSSRVHWTSFLTIRYNSYLPTFFFLFYHN